MRTGGREQVTVYVPNQRASMGFWESWAAMLVGVYGSRELIWQLFKRDFFANYKQSYLGILWIFITPVVGIVSWVILNATGVLVPGDVGVPYPVYVLVGSSIWGLFISFYSSTAKSLIEYKALIIQINFPHEALVVKQIAQTLAAFLINLVLLLVVLVAFRITPGITILLFPVSIIPLMFLGAGIGMIVSVVTAVANDVGKAVAALLGFVMYITPVIYGPDQKSELLNTVIRYNPLTYLVGGSRAAIIGGQWGGAEGYTISASASAVFFLIAWRLFFLSEGKVAEKL